MRNIAASFVALALGACAAGAGTTPIVSDTSLRTARATPPPGDAVRQPKIGAEAGLEGVIGQRATALLGRFGKARIDLVEGDARKLQFAGDTCVMDVFLYPLESGKPAVATHVEAREREDGDSTSKSRCLAEISRR